MNDTEYAVGVALRSLVAYSLIVAFIATWIAAVRPHKDIWSVKNCLRTWCVCFGVGMLALPTLPVLGVFYLAYGLVLIACELLKEAIRLARELWEVIVYVFPAFMFFAFFADVIWWLYRTCLFLVAFVLWDDSLARSAQSWLTATAITLAMAIPFGFAMVLADRRGKEYQKRERAWRLSHASYGGPSPRVYTPPVQQPEPSPTMPETLRETFGDPMPAVRRPGSRLKRRELPLPEEQPKAIPWEEHADDLPTL